MLVSRNIEEGEIEVDGINNTHRIINETMSTLIDGNMVEAIVNEKDEIMNRDYKWVVGERIIGSKTKRV